MFATLAAFVVLQIPQSNPVVDAVQSLGRTGMSASAAPAKSPTSFQPSGNRVYVSKFVTEMFDGAEERAAIEPLLKQVIDNFDAESKKWGSGNDASEAVAFSVATLYSLASGNDIDEKGVNSLASSIKSTLDIEKIRSTANAQKQEAYEWAVCSVGYILIVASAASGDDAEAKIKQLAGVQLAAMTGATLDQFQYAEKSIRIKGKTPTTTASTNSPSRSSGTAPGFDFSVPNGWKQEGVWHVLREQPDPYSGITSASVRFLPAVPTGESFSTIVRSLWKQAVPVELASAGSNMVFRRYMGNGAIAHFIFGKGLEKGKDADTVFTLYLVDCGKFWQPIVVAQTYEDESLPRSAMQMTAGFSYPKSAAMAETLLSTIKSPARPFQTIIDPSALTGTYHFGNSASLQWENIYTGASSMTFVSYGGSLALSANGSFNYTYSSASGQVGAAKFRGAKGSGSWKVDKDELICTFKSYDQGDGYFVKEHRYRIAGVVVFADGSKVCVFKSDLKAPINACTIGESGDYFSTKKKPD